MNKHLNEIRKYYEDRAFFTLMLAYLWLFLSLWGFENFSGYPTYACFYTETLAEIKPSNPPVPNETLINKYSQIKTIDGFIFLRKPNEYIKTYVLYENKRDTLKYTDEQNNKIFIINKNKTKHGNKSNQRFNRKG